LTVVQLVNKVFVYFEGEASMKQIASLCCLLHADFLLGLFFDPEDEGDIFLRNVC
jgi:hypothetical protein